MLKLVKIIPQIQTPSSGLIFETFNVRFFQTTTSDLNFRFRSGYRDTSVEQNDYDDYRTENRSPRKFSSNDYDYENRSGSYRGNRQNYPSYRSDFQSNNSRGSNIHIPKKDWDNCTLSECRKDFSDLLKDSELREQAEIDEYKSKHNMTVKGSGVPKPALKFSDIDFPEGIKSYISSKKFEAPTPVQAIGLPCALSGRDFIGIGQTGSGKTLGFLLPAIVHIQHRERLVKNCPSALVLSPTRELTQQTNEVLQGISRYTNTSGMSIFGGAKKDGQISQIMKYQPSVWAATPGRLLDLISSGVADVSDCSYLVLDEADRMLDMGFEPQITQIIEQMRSDRQTQLWSATWPEEVHSLAYSFLKNPIRANLGSTDLTANPDVEQRFVFCKGQKLGHLVSSLKSSQKAIVFANTKRQVDTLEAMLYRQGIRASTIHGGHSQSSRDFALRGLKRGATKVLIATDVAARGIDVTDIDLVVNYDMPTNAESYVHRIGRTGRAGQKGMSVSLMTLEDQGVMKQIKKLLLGAGQEVPEDLQTILEETDVFETQHVFPKRKYPGRRRF